jgi:hypothetical protein
MTKDRKNLLEYTALACLDRCQRIEALEKNTE